VGFGDVSSNGNQIEMIAAMFWMLIGTFCASSLIGNFVVSIQTLDKENELKNRKIDALK
jgi:hypothetical protein